MASWFRRSAVSLFFLGLLLCGLSIYKDYGVHWDEYNNQEFGHKWKVYVLDVAHTGSITQSYPTVDEMDLRHGPFVELSLNFLKNALKINSLKEIILFRHLCCFFIFILGVFFFYLLCNRFFKDWKIALLGCVFLVLSPRIFAHSFYDTFDIPFLSFYVISIYTMFRFLDQKNVPNAIFHALACAILIDTRLAGLIIPLLTLIFFKPKDIKPFFLYGLSLIFLVILGWPLLWPDPLTNFLKVFLETHNSNFPYSCLFWGKFYMGYDLPWYSTWVWIFVTTPLFYSVFFLIGCVFMIKDFKITKFDIHQRNTILIFLCFLIPLLLANGKTYNGWRHLYFIYPPFLMITLIGLFSIWKEIRTNLDGQMRNVLQTIVLVITSMSLAGILWMMIKLHPYEHVYFNRLAGKDMHEVKGRFELDYWGVSYKQALEYLLKHDPQELISISGGDNSWPLITNNLNILDPQDKKRFIQTTPDKAQYMITNYLQHPNDYPFPKYASLSIGNAEILTIYKLK